MNQKVKMKPSYLKIAFLDRDGTLIKDYPDGTVFGQFTIK